MAAGPWEKYQSGAEATAEGEAPWLKYQAAAEPAGTGEGSAPPDVGPASQSGGAVRSVLAGGNRAVADLIGLPVDTVANVMDLGRAAVGTAVAAAGRPDLVPSIPERARIVGSSEWFAARMARTGAQMAPSDPDSKLERTLFAAGRGAASAAAGPASASALAGNAARGAASGVAAQEVAESTDDPVLATAAGLAAGRAPEAAAMSARAVRGTSETASRMRDTIDDFRRVGADPTLGQASESRALQGIESTLGRVPGSAGVIAKRAEQQQADIGAGVARISDSLSPNSSTRRAGIQIERGVSEFVDRFKAKSSELYGELDKFIAPDTSIDVSNTTQALQRMTAPIQGAAATSKLLENPKLAGVKEALDADLAAAQNGKLPYEAVKDLRSKVGAMMATPSLMTDIPTGELKQLYRGLSADMEAAAKAAGPEAARAFNRAKLHYAAGRGRINELDRVVQKAGGPEAIFGAAMSGTKEGASHVQAVLKSLPEDGRRVVAATVLERMGRATPGQQDASGAAFSTQAFLTNWARLSPEARDRIFGAMGPSYVRDIDTIARVADNLRKGSAAYANPSGTAKASAGIGGLVALGSAAGTGNAPLAAKILAGMASTNVAARAMTNPKVVSWLANTTETPEHVARPEMFRTVAQLLDDGDDDLAGALLQSIPDEDNRDRHEH